MEKIFFLQLREVNEYIEFLKSEFNNNNINLRQCLKDYKWPENSKGIDFENTYVKIKELRENFKMYLSKNDVLKTHELCKNILEWGGVGVATKNLKRISILIDENKFISTLNYASLLIRSNNIEKEKIVFPVNSGFSKIYACLYDKFIIYDSRVAAKMCSLISFKFSGKNPFQLGKADFQAKANRDPGKEFQMISGNDKKYFESNIKASWIIEELANRTKYLDFTTEKLIFAYQTAFFVLGKNLDNK